MPSGGEVEAVLTARDNMSPVMENAAAKVKVLASSLREGGEETGRFAKEMDALDRVATRMLERLAILWALRSAKEFVAELEKTASKMVNLADEFDTSVTHIERWDQAARMSGQTISVMTNAADALVKKLAKGDKGLGDALDQLGLSWEQVWSADAGQRMEMIGRALDSVTDKVTRSGLEFEIFGTDKLDSALRKLKDVAGTMDDEVAKAIDKDNKAMLVLGESTKATAAYFLDLGRNMAAWALSPAAAMYRQMMGEGDVPTPTEGDLQDPSRFEGFTRPPAATDEESVQAFNDAYSRSLKPPKPNFGPGAASPNMLNPVDVSKETGLRVAAALEKEITDSVKLRVLHEKEEEKQIRENAKELISEMEVEDKLFAAYMKRQMAMLVGSNKNLLDEEKAKAANRAALGFAPDGVTPLALYNDPREVARRSSTDVHNLNEGPASTFERDRQIQRELNDSIDKEIAATNASAQAFFELNSKNKSLGAATDKLTASIHNASASYDLPTSTPKPFGEATAQYGAGGYLGKGYSRAQMDLANLPGGVRTHGSGGPTVEGPAYVHDDEYVVPKGGTLVKSGGGTTNVTVQVQGNVYTMDPSGKAAFAAQIRDAVDTVIRQGRKLPAA